MSVPYDELFISTRREINVCEGAIRKLRKTLEDMESKYRLETREFIARFGRGEFRENEDFLLWRESGEGLENWEERLEGLREILQNPPQ
jgi:phosphoglycolate phosphatase-like HAD superfamily hydrolase